MPPSNQLSIQILSLALQVLSENISHGQRHHFVELYKTTGAFNGDIKDNVLSVLRRFIPDSALPDGLWDSWWAQVLRTWLGLPAPTITNTSEPRGRCRSCGH